MAPPSIIQILIMPSGINKTHTKLGDQFFIVQASIYANGKKMKKRDSEFTKMNSELT